jgi:hypothetical protein
LNDDPDFESETDKAIEILQQMLYSVELDTRQKSFCRIHVPVESVSLKLDFINDVKYHCGDFHQTPVYYKTDNPINILSNKIAALSRQMTKDIADIIFISRKYAFYWPDIISDAAMKDNWVNEVDVLAAIKSFDAANLWNEIAWIQMPDQHVIYHNIKQICYDIATAGKNSLFSV